MKLPPFWSERGSAALAALVVSLVAVSGLAQERPESMPAGEAAAFETDLESEGEPDPEDYAETVPLPETIERVDVEIGRVRVAGDGEGDRNAKRWTERRLERTAGDLIRGCFEGRPGDDLSLEEPMEPISAEQSEGDLTLMGGCGLGICTLRPRLSGGLDRSLGLCIAQAVASSLSGFPDPEREYELRIPLRFRVVIDESAPPPELEP